MSATRTSLAADLLDLGVRAGGVLMVHSSVRSMGPVTGGVHVVIQALLDALGPLGTIAAYGSFTPHAITAFFTKPADVA